MVGGSGVWYSHFGTLAVLPKLSIWLSNRGPKYLPKRNAHVCQKAVQECSQYSSTTCNHVINSQTPLCMFAHWWFARPSSPSCLLPHTWMSQSESPGAHPLAQAGSSNHTNSSPIERDPSPGTPLPSPHTYPITLKSQVTPLQLFRIECEPCSPQKVYVNNKSFQIVKKNPHKTKLKTLQK